MNPDPSPPDAPPPPLEEEPTRWQRVRRVLIGRPRDLADRSIFHRIALMPFLAWVGLGADGLSSSSYGPEEAFRALGEHAQLAVFLALAVAVTVLVISAAYSRIIEEFPHGGGGYVVATKLLGPSLGVVSGAALVVDYVLTITVSIAAAGDALFSLLPLHLHVVKPAVELFLIVGLTTLNLRGAKESTLALAPIFVLFLLTHVILIGSTLLISSWSGWARDRPACTNRRAPDSLALPSQARPVGPTGSPLLPVATPKPDVPRCERAWPAFSGQEPVAKGGSTDIVPEVSLLQ